MKQNKVCYSIKIFLIIAFCSIISIKESVSEEISNYVLDKTIISPEFGDYPNKGESRQHSITGAKIKRLANHEQLDGNYGNNKPEQSLIVYSRYTPTNTSGEFILVHGDDSTSCWISRLSDNDVAPFGASSKIPIRFKPSMGSSSRALGEVNELRWDYSGNFPYRLYFVGRSIKNAHQTIQSENPAMSFYYTDIDPDTGINFTPVLIRDFTNDFGNSTDLEIMNDVEGDSSNDSRYWAWQVMNTNLGSGYLPFAIFTYDKQANIILGSLRRDCSGSEVSCTEVDTPATSTPYISRPNMVEISPKGTRVIVHWGRTYSGKRQADTGTVADGPKAFLKDFSDPIRIAADETHSGWAWGKNGEEMFVSQNNRNDFIEAVDIASSATANCSLISDNSYSCGIKVIAYKELDMNNWTLGMHFGKIYDDQKRGWLFINTYDNNYSSWGKNQNLFIEIKAYNSSPEPKIWRVNPSYNVCYDYRSEGSGALDFNSTSIFLTANWGYKDGRGEAYSIGLPSDWHVQLDLGGTTSGEIDTPTNLRIVEH